MGKSFGDVKIYAFQVISYIINIIQIYNHLVFIKKKKTITDEVGLESHQQYHVLDRLNLPKL